MFRTVAWRAALLKNECGETCDITEREASAPVSSSFHISG